MFDVEAGAVHGFGAYEGGGGHHGEPVGGCLVECHPHECLFEAGDVAFEEVEAGARYLGAACHVDTVDEFADFEVVAGFEAFCFEVAGLAHVLDDDVVVFAAGGDSVDDEVADGRYEFVLACLGGFAGGFSFGDLLGEFFDLCEEGLLFFFGGLADFFGEYVLFGAEVFEFDDGGAAGGVSFQDLVDDGFVGAAGALGGAEYVGVFAEKVNVDHALKFTVVGGWLVGWRWELVRTGWLSGWFRMLVVMVSRSVFVPVVAVAAGGVVGAALGVHRARRVRPDLFPVYRPLHRMIEPGEVRQVAVVFNPTKSRAGTVLDMVTAELARAGWPKARLYETTREDPGGGMARQAVADGADVVVAMGGDGTVRAVADGLRGSSAALGIVPLGTGNLLARNLEMDVSDLHACINVALHGESRAIDMIHLELQGVGTTNLPPVNYLVMGGAGFDAQIMTDTREELKAAIGWLAYVEASVRHMFTRRRPAMISVDGGNPFGRKIRTVLIANCGKIQGGVNLASVAEASDGQLEVIVLTPRNLLSWVRMSFQFIARKPDVWFPVVEHFVGQEIEVTFPKDPLPVEVDGDVLGEVTALRARVMPGAVCVNVYPDNMLIRTFDDFMQARDALVEEQRRWWQRFLRL